MAGARNIRYRRPRTGRNKNICCRNYAPAGELNAVCTCQHSSLVEYLNLVATQRLAIKALQSIYLGGHIVSQYVPIEGRPLCGPAKTLRVLQIFSEVGTIYQQLFGYAASDYARASDAMLFGHGNTRAVRCSDPGGADAAGAGANDEKVIIKLSHIYFFPRYPRYGHTRMLLPTRILELSYRTNARCLVLPKRRLYQRCSGRIKAAWSVVRDAFGNMLAELNTELVKWVNP